MNQEHLQILKQGVEVCNTWRRENRGLHPDLRGANLVGANLREADLSRATLHQAHLTAACLLGSNFEGADLTGCFVYGISAWNVKLEGTTQLNLVITPAGEPVITADNLEVAQFIYLLLHNAKIREVIETTTSKAVRILGRFTPEAESRA